MRLAKPDAERDLRDWPDPKDLAFVRAGAALLGFSIGKERHSTHWYIGSDGHHQWYLYGTTGGEIQGPWIPENDLEWIAALRRIRLEVNKVGGSRGWGRPPTIFDEVFRREQVTAQEAPE